MLRMNPNPDSESDSTLESDSESLFLGFNTFESESRVCGIRIRANPDSCESESDRHGIRILHAYDSCKFSISIFKSPCVTTGGDFLTDFVREFK